MEMRLVGFEIWDLIGIHLSEMTTSVWLASCVLEVHQSYFAFSAVMHSGWVSQVAEIED